MLHLLRKASPYYESGIYCMLECTLCFAHVALVAITCPSDTYISGIKVSDQILCNK